MDERKYYVYEWYIVNTNEVFYVGKGKGNRYRQTKGRNYFFQCMYNTRNCDVRKIYENLSEEEAFQKEIETIKYYKECTDYRLTNQTDGGDGTSGWIAPQEFKDKQSLIQKQQWQDKDFRQKMLDIRNREDSPYKSKEFRDKISKLVQGENNPNYNNSWTTEQRQKLREKQQRNPLYKDETNPNAEKIICIETGEVFECVKFAKEKYKIKTDGSITVALKNKIRTAGGMHWVEYSEEFLDEEYRRNYLIEALKENKHIAPIICLEDLKLYVSKTELANKLNITTTKITWQLNKTNKFVYQNKTYILLENF